MQPSTRNTKATSTQDLPRDQKWAKDGVKAHPLPQGMVQLSMRGGHMLNQPKPGDHVELYTDDDKGKPQWVGGYVALSSIEPGEQGGPYDGQSVVFVGKAGQNTMGQEVQGDEWPADMLRLAKSESKTPFAGRDAAEQDKQQAEAQNPQDKGTKPASFSVGWATFLKETVTKLGLRHVFDENELRGYHGKWVGGGAGVTKGTPAGRVLEEANTKDTPRQIENARVKALGIEMTPEIMKAQTLKLYDEISPEDQKSYTQWYYEVHDMTVEWAKQYGVTPELIASVIAATSPQTGWWDERVSTITSFGTQNQGYVYNILDLVLAHGDDEIDITEEDAARFRAKKYLSTEKDPKTGQFKWKTNKNRIEITNYDGMEHQHDGTNWIGHFKLKDLPADILAGVRKPNGIMATRAAVAIILARGADPNDPLPQKSDKKATVLNGPKVRSFYNNIIDPYHSMDATIDTHMLMAMTASREYTDPETGVVGRMPKDKVEWLASSPGAYQMMNDIIAAAAKERGLKPHEMQAAVWVHWRDMHKGEKHTGGAVVAIKQHGKNTVAAKVRAAEEADQEGEDEEE